MGWSQTLDIFASWYMLRSNVHHFGASYRWMQIQDMIQIRVQIQFVFWPFTFDRIYEHGPMENKVQNVKFKKIWQLCSRLRQTRSLLILKMMPKLKIKGRKLNNLTWILLFNVEDTCWDLYFKKSRMLCRSCDDITVPCFPMLKIIASPNDFIKVIEDNRQ